MRFLRQILSGQKKLLNLKQVKYIQAREKYRLLSVRRVLEICRDEGLRVEDYLPDYTSETEIDRSFLHNVSIN